MGQPIFLRRSNILPKRPSDYPLLLFMSFIIPASYWFEMWVVLPSLFSDHPILYWTGFVLGHFLLHNLVGNFLGILISDTSIRGREMPSEDEQGVQFCSSCNTITPPRSFHCPSCDICILKRDHHCLFTSCCVGFYNHRYFFLFVFYLMLSTLICLPFNIYFLWGAISMAELSLLMAIFCPVLLFFMDVGSRTFEIEQLYLLISAFGLVGVIFCSTMTYFHMKLILRGTVVHEMRKCINDYNMGEEKNLQIVFGKRWYLTWISPYLKSPLICDGIKYQILPEDKAE